MSRTGTVKNWNEEKGFGFIGPDDAGEDLFCHRSGLSGLDALDKGDKVRYDESMDDRKNKMRASNVTLASGGGGGAGGGGGDRRETSSYGGGGSGGGYGGGGGGGGRDDRSGGGRDDRDGGRDDRRGGGGRDDRDGGRDDRGGGRDDYGSRGGGGGRDDRGGGGRSGGMEKFGGRTRGDDISEGGNRHVTARELYMTAQKPKRRDSRSRSR